MAFGARVNDSRNMIPLRRFGSTLLIVGTISAGAISLADRASAQPSGCTDNAISLTVNAQTKSMTSSTSSTCATNGNRTIVAEIKWDKAFAPDPLVAKNSSTSNILNRSVSVSTCDGGNTRGYYGRGYFTANTTFWDTSPRVITTC